MVRSQALKLTKMTLEKTLEAHPEKFDKYKEKVKKELETSPIYLTNFKLEIKDSDKYLGQSISSSLYISARPRNCEV